MYKRFETKKKKGLTRGKNTDMLLIDNDVLEYTFVKRRAKTLAEMHDDFQHPDVRKIYKNIETTITVILDLKDLLFVKYDKALNNIIIVGKFVVMRKNAYYEQEMISNYDEEGSCFAFEYNFEDLDEFLKILNTAKKLDSCNIPLIPISL